ncbi:drug/metabolite transporter (DMT)-like permease [Mobilisporobacter senegalensis]|uniref:Drug/metabolite transporter (DMT)-like permease n=1 Tax=Mobilisporobacter senegalensis TaxID=1329262 RepID=A0A3N1XRI8_9FIRM|nr:DMT family transporter [Mobilisporobacter senegalensis]ROR29256.1 drug/metabolite transporter (DMT)-like permease [Mobilisporobacter senegalensis]
MKTTSEKLIGHILATVTIIIWGTTFIASKLLLEEFTPLQVMIMRFIIAYITLFILNHKIQKTTWKEELVFLSLAITGTTIYFLCENQALTITLVSNVSILLSVAPLLTAILAHFYTKDEKVNNKVILGSMIAFIGVAFVVFNGTVVLQLNPLGDILSFGAALSWAIYSVILKKNVKQYDSVYLTRKVVFYSLITTFPLLFLEGAPFPFKQITTPSFLFSLIFLGVLGSGICYVAWNIATKKIGIITTNNYIYVNPFVTMIAAGIILDEKITIMGILGALFILVGVIVAGMKGNIKVEKLNKVELD